MAGRGRRIAVALILLALVLSAGRWGADFLADRWWEAAVSPRVATAGARHALLTLGLELSLIILASVWFLTNFTVAARIALPDQRPPEHETARIWPAELPRWSLAVIALVMGVLLGGGAGTWLFELLLALDGARLGVRDPLLIADLGAFTGKVPLWLHLQSKAVLLITAGLGGVILLHLTGETIRIVERRLWVSPRARVQLALLLALLALGLGWSSLLEPYRLAAGLRGPLLSSEFAFRDLVAKVQAGLAAAVAAISLLWLFRVRGAAIVAAWVLLAGGLLVGRGLPLHGEAAISDPTWQSAARALDSTAFQLAGLEDTAHVPRPRADSITPSLWDDTILTQAIADSGRLSEPHRGWLPGTAGARPVWLTVRAHSAEPPELLAVSDDQISPQGSMLAWKATDRPPTPGVAAFRVLEPQSIQPLAPRIRADSQAPGVALDGWARRLVLAWSLQAPAAFSAPPGSRISWRLDPATRLRAAAPFVHWTPPRARVVDAGVFWQSDGLLTSNLFPSSARVDWGAGATSMVRSALLGIVHAASGEVRIFRRADSDSLAAAWARITHPLIEAPSAVPEGLREGEAYSEELLLAQARVLEGPPWGAGRLERISGGPRLLTPAAPGGSERLVPFLHAGEGNVGAVLRVMRTPTGDALRLVRLDSLSRIDGTTRLKDQWERFPFRQAISDSVDAAGADMKQGAVRFALSSEGVVAYQPFWALNASNEARLVLINVAIGRRGPAGRILVGTGRTYSEALKNLRGLAAPAAGSSPAAVLEEAGRLMRRADSAQLRGDGQERERILQQLRVLLERWRR